MLKTYRVIAERHFENAPIVQNLEFFISVAGGVSDDDDEIKRKIVKDLNLYANNLPGAYIIVLVVIEI